MTTTIMTRAAVRLTEAAAYPEYACGRCHGWHSGACPAAMLTPLSDLALRMAREADARVPHGRRARRTLQEMAPGSERQPVLVLHRPVMAGDRCPVCDRWNCAPSNCPPASAVPAPATAGPTLQCAVCGGWFGATGTPGPAVGWTCGACQNLGC